MCAILNPNNGKASIVDWVDNERAVTGLIRFDSSKFKVDLNRLNYPQTLIIFILEITPRNRYEVPAIKTNTIPNLLETNAELLNK